MTAGPEEAEILLQRGDDALARGDRDGALHVYRMLIEGFPERPEGYNKMGVVYAEMGNSREAERCFLASLARERRYPPALSNLGNIYLERGDVDSAISHYSLALEVDPSYAPAHHNLAVALRRKGDVTASVRHLKRARQLGEPTLATRGARRLQGPPARWLVWALLALAAILLVVHRA